MLKGGKMTQRRYWVVSPNVKNDEKTVEGWKKEILDHHIAIMGYGPDEYTGKKGRGNTGPKFAGRGDPSVQQGDIILIGRSRKGKELVAVGIVASESRLEPFPELHGHDEEVQVRDLKPFKNLTKLTKAEKSDVEEALSKALPHRGAMRELRDSNEDKRVKKWLDRWLSEIGDQHDDGSSSRRKPRQSDMQLRHKVEEAAYRVVEKFYTDQQYEVRGVQREKCGYDLKASKNRRTLKIEVKGLRGPKANTELTPKEYKYIKQKDKEYRLCIVTNALNYNQQRIQEFKFDSGKPGWFDQDRKELVIKERVAARVEG
jgi:hypothetical protein